MRHLAGIVLAIVAALAIFFGGGWGYLRLLTVPVAGHGQAGLPGGGGPLLHDHRVLFAQAALLAVGLLIGLLMVAPWVSPLAAGLPGLALLALFGLYLTNVDRAVRLIPLRTHPYGLGFEALLFNGILAAAGLAMIIPLFVPSRWRRRAVLVPVPPYAIQSGLLTSEDTAVTQPGIFFGTQEFPAATDPYPPTQEQNPYPR